MGYGTYHITVRLQLDEHGGSREREHGQLAKDLLHEIKLLINESQDKEHGWPAIVYDIDSTLEE